MVDPKTAAALTTTEWMAWRALHEFIEGHVKAFPGQGIQVFMEVRSDNQVEGSTYKLGVPWVGLVREYLANNGGGE